MSFTKDEYKNLIDDFTKDVKEHLSSEIKSLLLTGSVVADVHILGESDCDFVLVIDDKYEENSKLEKTLNKIGEILKRYVEDPLYTSLIDLEIIEPSLIPSMPASKILFAQKGKALIGDNPFVDIEVTDEQLKESAKRIGQEFYSQMKELFLYPPEEEYDAIYIAVDSVLGCASAFLYYKGERDFYRSNLHDLINEKYSNELPTEPVFTSYKLRLGSKKVKLDNFLSEAFDFCVQVMKIISK